MAQSVKALRVEVEIEGLFAGDDGAQLVVDWAYDKTFTAGGAVDQVERVYQDLERALTTTGEDVDLGTVTDFENNALGLADVKVIALRNLSNTEGETAQLKAVAVDDIGLFAGSAGLHNVGPGGLFIVINPTAGGYTAGDNIGLDASASLDVYLLVAGDTGS
ncbi:MAG: hypothetical protein AAFV53_31765 [Myxococcota bacterium]